jgi:hypothetical protein
MRIDGTDINLIESYRGNHHIPPQGLDASSIADGFHSMSTSMNTTTTTTTATTSTQGLDASAIADGFHSMSTSMNTTTTTTTATTSTQGLDASAMLGSMVHVPPTPYTASMVLEKSAVFIPQPSSEEIRIFGQSAIFIQRPQDLTDSVTLVAEDSDTEDWDLLEKMAGRKYSGIALNVLDYVKNVVIYPILKAKDATSDAIETANRAHQAVGEVNTYVDFTKKGLYSACFLALSVYMIYSMPAIALGYAAILGSTALADHFMGNQNHELLKSALIAAPILMVAAAPYITAIPFVVNEFLNPDLGKGFNRVISAANLALESDNRAVNVYNLITGNRADLGSQPAAALFIYAAAIGYVAPFFKMKDVTISEINLSEQARTLFKGYLNGISEKVFEAGKTVVDFASLVRN